MIEKNMICSKKKTLVKIEIGTDRSSIWELMEIVAEFLAISQKYKGEYIQLEPRELKEGETKAVEFELSFTNKRSCKKFLKAAENII